MAQVRQVVIKFKQSVAPDVVANNVRIRPANSVAAYDTPVDTVPAPVPGEDGYCRIPLSAISQAQGLEGRYDVHLTAVDGAGNESDFLEIDNQVFDLSPPAAPTDGSLE